MWARDKFRCRQKNVSNTGNNFQDVCEKRLWFQLIELDRNVDQCFSQLVQKCK